MKKSLVVLLIAVLALSAVFAADVAITVEGDVSASYVVDFDNGITATYNVPSLNGELAWEVVLPVAKAGSEYPYIDVAGEIEVDLTEVALSLAPEVDFSTFAIVGEDWKVDFLAKIGTLDYAVSAIDKGEYEPLNAYMLHTGRNVKSSLTYRWLSAADYKKAVAITKDGIGTLTLLGTKTDAVASDKVIKTAYFKNPGVASDYMALMNQAGYKCATPVYVPEEDAYMVVVQAGKNYADATTIFAVEAESEELKLSDSITTQFGFGFAKKETSSTKMNAGFSTKSSYEDILTVAADFGYDFKAKENNFSVDVASSFKYEMVSVDVYYAHGPLCFFNNGEDFYARDTYYTYGYTPYYTEYTHSGDLLSAKAAVEVEEIGTTFTFTGKDVLTTPKLAYEAVNTYFDNYTFTFEASTKLSKNVAVGFEAEADYSEEVGVTAYAGVSAEGTYDKEGKLTVWAPVFEAGFAYAKDGFSFSVDFSTDVEDDYVCVENSPAFALTVKSGYEAETFTLSGAVEYNTHETAAYKNYYGWTLDPGLYVTAGIESDKLVDGATLSLDYESGELLDGHPGNGQYGSLTAAVTVEF